MPAGAETDDVYAALVAELARIALPTTIMAITLAAVGLFIAQVLGHAFLFAAVAVGLLASACKLALIVLQMRRLARGPLARKEARRWEWGQILTTIGVASSVGALVGTVFAQPRMDLQMLATGLLFGYCSGVVTHLSVRPFIAAGALLLAALPAIVSAAWGGGMSHGILATMFSLFLVGALQSVLSAHRTAIRQIRLRLDMAALARSDALTGLANRLGLRGAFDGLSATGNDSVAIHCFDLDGFKPVNDRFGHAAGDALLQELGARLRLLLAAPALAARIGGDEFVVLQPGVRHVEEAETLARRIVHALGAPYQLGTQTVTVGLSLGFACAPSASADLDDLLREADAASYAVKRRGGGVAAGGLGGAREQERRAGTMRV
ncbi:GGDEF domain-containing protein [Methylobacterium sp. SyP6R]|uniref:GGDEF domain-containing protein n=1 Tax=Methylobacterium sp. SyP6R TaxID=2718876 RepID=UPI001F19DBA4|nr:GGDEF domain-containing protein [Methylobacterium sp. SyP6R]MCF4126071.1 GGDEF domain-containing protein [Methylobacterium sp. SyP6R]